MRRVGWPKWVQWHCDGGGCRTSARQFDTFKAIRSSGCWRVRSQRDRNRPKVDDSTRCGNFAVEKRTRVGQGAGRHGDRHFVIPQVPKHAFGTVLVCRRPR